MGKSSEDKETCGRCAMSSVSEVMDDNHDPFDGDRIEIEEGELRKISPSVFFRRVKRRVDGVVAKLTYRR